MQDNLSQTYDVDSRYDQGKMPPIVVDRIDNTRGKDFVKRYLKERVQQNEPNITEQRREDDRFVVAGPGDSLYSFHNPFRAKQ